MSDSQDMLSPKHRSLYTSHGSPDMVLEDVNTACSQFLENYGKTHEMPSAFVIITSHYDAQKVLISASAHPETVHDIGPIDQRLFDIQYPAPGHPELAAKIQKGLKQAGFEAELDHERGFDHGTWVPMLLMNPEMDVPVVLVALDTTKDAKWHYELGQALGKNLPDDVAIMGSGNFTHDLTPLYEADRFLDRDAPILSHVTEFEGWMHKRLLENNVEELFRYRELAPHAVRNHGSGDHILPLFVAMGAGTAAAELIHNSYEFGAVSMNSYAFG